MNASVICVTISRLTLPVSNERQLTSCFPGVRGLMLAALLASLMSTLTSVFNSASSIVTLDLWGQFRKNAKQAELMIVGRITVLVMVVISILWLPVLQAQQGGLLWFYIAAICAYLSVPWCMAFLLGLFWKRTSEPVS